MAQAEVFLFYGEAVCSHPFSDNVSQANLS